MFRDLGQFEGAVAEAGVLEVDDPYARAVPADKDCTGAGIGIRIPVRRPRGKSEQALHVDTRLFNTLLRHVRALGERTTAELEQRWRALRHVTLSPGRIGDIARAALVLNRIWK
ncbi:MULTISPECIES: transposase family protein [Streptomyces]|uniref:transposase family protein n=1 Tax=Streptomyces TaxID=1883 RepID=UPI001558BEE4|nr:transposase family protein [Streptomyces kasugaensis]